MKAAILLIAEAILSGIVILVKLAIEASLIALPVGAAAMCYALSGRSIEERMAGIAIVVFVTTFLMCKICGRVTNRSN